MEPGWADLFGADAIIPPVIPGPVPGTNQSAVVGSGHKARNDRNLGSGSIIKVPRGKNELWSRGVLVYSAPRQ
jgi:hypothetical protein